MEVIKKEYIIIKTKEISDHDIAVGECLFVVEKTEWEHLGKHITKESFTYTKSHCCEKEIRLYDLYHRAQIFQADERTINFLLENGIDTALKYLRKGTRQSRNRENLYNIFNKLAIFREMENFPCEYHIVIDFVSISKSSYFGIEKDETVLAWKLPSKAEEVKECQEFNSKLLEEALKENRNTLISILNAKRFWCDLGVSDIDFKITIPDDTCLWDPVITVKAKYSKSIINAALNSRLASLASRSDNQNELYIKPELIEPKNDTRWDWPPFPMSYEKNVNMKYFLGEFLPSLTKENYKEQLDKFFGDSIVTK